MPYPVEQGVVGVTGERRIEFAQQVRVAVAQFGAFAQPLAGCVILHDQTATRLGQPVALFAQPMHQIIPISRLGEIISEKRPQESDEPLIRPYRRLRFVASIEITVDRIADHLADAYIFGLRHARKRSEGRFGQFQNDLMHIHRCSIAADG